MQLQTVRITIGENDVREMRVHPDSVQLLIDTVVSMGGKAERVIS